MRPLVDATYCDAVGALEWVARSGLSPLATAQHAPTTSTSEWCARVGYLDRRHAASSARSPQYWRWRKELLARRYARKRSGVEERLFTAFAEKKLREAQVAECIARREDEEPPLPLPPPRGAMRDNEGWVHALRSCDVVLLDGTRVEAVSFAPGCGDLFAATCASGVVLICSLGAPPQIAPHVIARLEGHTRAVRTIAWDARDAWLLSSSDDSTVRLWSVASAIAEARAVAQGALSRLMFSSGPISRRAVHAAPAVRIVHRPRVRFCRFHPRDSRVAVICLARGASAGPAAEAAVELLDLRDADPRAACVASLPLRAPFALAAAAFGGSDGAEGTTDLFLASHDAEVRCVRLRCPPGRALADAKLVELSIDTGVIAAAVRRGDAAGDGGPRGGAVRLSCAPLERAASMAAPARRLHADRLACDTLLLLTARSGAHVLARLSARDDYASVSTVAPPRGGCAILARSGGDHVIAAMSAPGELVLDAMTLGDDDGSVALELAPRRAPRDGLAYDP